jgi:3-phosphoshikimate 1-carboxyvinyltransferase
MKCKVDKSRLSGVIKCPPNKSYSHRAVFLASLSNGKSTLRNVLLSRDTLATINACKVFGAKIEINDSTVMVESKGEIIPQTREIDAPILAPQLELQLQFHPF